ncbi:DUF1572 family protein [Paludisphaera rhizosphaerae]|uniref:DUF1572 family protein n=1 Tax=Paludisphaera rhizosphaerae TaxID=2711216 RepID=UPI0013ED1E54|nr:DUF1572 family protein [Paludisphaera rhizosphaerae]
MSPIQGEDAVARAFLIEARTRLDESVGLIRHCVGQLDEQQLWWRPREGMNSIGNLLLHLAGNLRQRFRSDVGGEPDVRDRFGEFTERRELPKAELLQRFDEAVAGAEDVLDGLSPTALVETRRTNRSVGEIEVPVLAILFQALTHLTGHAQEIVSMTRMQLGDRYQYRSPGLVPPEMRPKD